MQRLVLVALVAVISGALSSSVVATVALATIPDASKVIQACYAGNDGSVRIVDSPSVSCKTNERPIAWSQGGVNGLEVVTKSSPGASNANAIVNAQCPAGKKVIGGGYHITGGTEPQVQQSFPQGTSGNAQGWQVGVLMGPIPITITSYAVCTAFVP